MAENLLVEVSSHCRVLFHTLDLLSESAERIEAALEADVRRYSLRTSLLLFDLGLDIHEFCFIVVHSLLVGADQLVIHAALPPAEFGFEALLLFFKGLLL